jgi:predicted small lipoprotein YifL
MKTVRLLIALACLAAAAACGQTHPLRPALEGGEQTAVPRPADAVRSGAPLHSGSPPTPPDSIGNPTPNGGEHGSGG